jgi:hypothetical protein
MDTPPARAPLGRPTLLTDLPDDLLRHILYLAGTEDGDDTGSCPYSCGRWAPTCSAFARAMRGPSEIWKVVRAPHGHVLSKRTSPGKEFISSIESAAKSVKSLTLFENCLPSSTEATEEVGAALATTVAPFLEELRLDSSYGRPDPAEDPAEEHVGIAWLEPVLAAATRLTRIFFGDPKGIFVDGPPGMLSAGRYALIAGEATISSHLFYRVGSHAALLALYRGLTVAAAAGPPGPVVLAELGGLGVGVEDTGRFALELGAQHLTRLGVWAASSAGMGVPGRNASLAALVSGLPALRDLTVAFDEDEGPVDLALDWRRETGLPRGLTSLAVGHRFGRGDVFLPPEVMGTLKELVLGLVDVEDPPSCLRDAGGSFSRLTRLVYGQTPFSDPYDLDIREMFVTDLAPWGTAAFAVPTLVELEVVGQAFTLGDYEGEEWAQEWVQAVATTTLPRLERLLLRLPPWNDDELPAFCGPKRRDREFDEDELAVVTHRLPAAAAAAGRRLVVSVDGILSTLDEIFELPDMDYAFKHAYMKYTPLRLR